MPDLVGPVWRKASRATRVLVLGGLAAIAIVVAAAVLTLEYAHYHHGGRVPFDFRYQHLYRSTPDPGGYVKVAAYSGGRLKASFAVEPLRLPPYQGSTTGELPLYASDYIGTLARRYADFDLVQEGKIRVNTIPGYAIAYSATLAGAPIYGREVLLTPPRNGARDGVDIVMLERSSKRIPAPQAVGTAGLDHLPLDTFFLGG